jgi:Xaa-Pro aminopeptidase
MKERINRCIKKIKSIELDSILISNPVNISYLTGFREAEGMLLLTISGEMVYFTNFLYKEEAKRINLWKVFSSNGNNIFELIKKAIKKLRLKKVGFEAKHLPYLEYKKIREELSEENIDFIQTIDIIERIRSIKSKKELSLIKKSIGIAKQTFEFIKDICDKNMTEKDLSIEIEKFLKLKGDNTIAFPPIVASGKNSAYPHYISGEERLNSIFYLIDLGSRYCGYCADLTRVFFWSKMPPLLTKIYNIIKKAQEVAIRKIKEGVKIKEVDRVAREFIEKKGFGKYFGHGLGHGIGLSVHEFPFINPKNDQILKEGMVITVEPAIYIPGKFGIRLEDMVLVKKERGEVLSGDFYF